jgi:two-component system, OmpR family, response regulator RegX3
VAANTTELFAARFQSILQLIDRGALERAEHELRHDALPTLRALLRTEGESPSEQGEAASRATSRLVVGPISIDVEGHVAWVDGREVRLPHREFGLLVYFARHEGRVCTRRALVAAIWADRELASTRTVDIHVYRLRMKLAPYTDLIETVRNVGYVLRTAGGAH